MKNPLGGGIRIDILKMENKNHWWMEITVQEYLELEKEAQFFMWMGLAAYFLDVMYNIVPQDHQYMLALPTIPAFFLGICMILRYMTVDWKKLWEFTFKNIQNNYKNNYLLNDFPIFNR